MIYFTDEIILPQEPVFVVVCNLLQFVLDRQPTYGEVAQFIAKRLSECTLLGIYRRDTETFDQRTLELSLLDHVIYELYLYNKHWFRLRSTMDKVYEVLVDPYAIYLIIPETQHDARYFLGTTVPKHRYHHHTFIEAVCR